MKRYDLMVHEEKDGTVHANMEEDVDGMYVTRHDAEQAIAAAVHAERRRVWNLIDHTSHLCWELKRLDGLSVITSLRHILFPDGELSLKRSPNAAPRSDDPEG